ncbi:hypothetical protein B5M09_007800 [Aphanomyces astaci]|uniref:Uncharacterized protein n=1 Tax=Aphanomyces astaci TaxID=112090 RepID=A0A425D5M0_APHAT|nr:hypothetical protein B5M09_007800 [Aphanomyces astaci]
MMADDEDHQDSDNNQGGGGGSRRHTASLRMRKYRTQKKEQFRRLEAEWQYLLQTLHQLQHQHTAHHSASDTTHAPARLAPRVTSQHERHHLDQQLALHTSQLRGDAEAKYRLACCLRDWVASQTPTPGLTPQMSWIYSTLCADPAARQLGFQWLSDRLYHTSHSVIPQHPLGGQGGDAMQLTVHTNADENPVTIVAMEFHFQFHTVFASFANVVSAILAFSNQGGFVVSDVIPCQVVEAVSDTLQYVYGANRRSGVTMRRVTNLFHNHDRTRAVQTYAKVADDECFPLQHGEIRTHGFGWFDLDRSCNSGHWIVRSHTDCSGRTVAERVAGSITKVRGSVLHYAPITNEGVVSLECMGSLFGINHHQFSRREDLIAQVRTQAQAMYEDAYQGTIAVLCWAMLDIDNGGGGRLSVGSLDDLTTAAQAGLFLLAQNEDLQVQITELTAQVAHQSHELELAAAKYDSCWRQRCLAMKEVTDVLKENHQLQRDLKHAIARALELERDAAQMESRLHVAESALNRIVQQDTKQQKSPPLQKSKWSAKQVSTDDDVRVPERGPSTTLLERYAEGLEFGNTARAEPPNQADSEVEDRDGHPTAVRTATPQTSSLASALLMVDLAAKLDKLAPLEHLYRQSVAALEVQTKHVQELQLEQAEERDLIASMRGVIAELKQLSTSTTPLDDKEGESIDTIIPETLSSDRANNIVPAASVSEVISKSDCGGSCQHFPQFKSLGVPLMLEGTHQLVEQLKAHTPLMWNAAIACLQDIWPAATEADFMDLTDWLHLAFRGTGLHRPLHMRNLSEDTVAQIVSTLVPLLQSACHRTVDIALFDRVQYTTDVILRC